MRSARVVSRVIKIMFGGAGGAALSAFANSRMARMEITRVDIKQNRAPNIQRPCSLYA